MGAAVSNESSAVHPHEPKVAPVLASDGSCLVCARSHLETQVGRLGSRVRELEGFIRLGLSMDKFHPADIAAWQRMAKAALREEQG